MKGTSRSWAQQGFTLTIAERAQSSRQAYLRECVSDRVPSPPTDNCWAQWGAIRFLPRCMSLTLQTSRGSKSCLASEFPDAHTGICVGRPTVIGSSFSMWHIEAATPRTTWQCLKSLQVGSWRFRGRICWMGVRLQRYQYEVEPTGQSDSLAAIRTAGAVRAVRAGSTAGSRPLPFD